MIPAGYIQIVTPDGTFTVQEKLVEHIRRAAKRELLNALAPGACSDARILKNVGFAKVAAAQKNQRAEIRTFARLEKMPKSTVSEGVSRWREKLNAPTKPNAISAPGVKVPE